MRKTFKKMIAVIALGLVVSLVAPTAFHTIAGPVKVEAATKKSSKEAIYFGELYGDYANARGYKEPTIAKVTMTKASVTIKGSLMVNGDYNNVISNSTRTFKLAKKCKYYIYGIDGEKKITKKKFMKLVKCYNGLGISVYKNKSGKIYRMDISS
ncbi:hypothetical protein [Eubacterium oxidoreducens]|uniref:Uncharacterized protein n=1 Tax=Eubacterium oxidoreducens TaxID=1732 RepID=A0A1G6C4L9_EUBOX|nr:hypothetical protein [Eubacterium oxidoreducens]SDB27826.1 hypothetical protein SAMN02910417_02086 [Eubacterium oxidoreducens]